jgi:hypothetical protein
MTSYFRNRNRTAMGAQRTWTERSVIKWTQINADILRFLMTRLSSYSVGGEFFMRFSHDLRSSVFICGSFFYQKHIQKEPSYHQNAHQHFDENPHQNPHHAADPRHRGLSNLLFCK